MIDYNTEALQEINLKFIPLQQDNSPINQKSTPPVILNGKSLCYYSHLKIQQPTLKNKFLNAKPFFVLAVYCGSRLFQIIQVLSLCSMHCTSVS